MAVAACGAPSGGSARESNDDPEKMERSGLAELPGRTRTARRIERMRGPAELKCHFNNRVPGGGMKLGKFSCDCAWAWTIPGRDTDGPDDAREAGRSAAVVTARGREGQFEGDLAPPAARYGHFVSAAASRWVRSVAPGSAEWIHCLR
jgi:hypothetical protein